MVDKTPPVRSHCRVIKGVTMGGKGLEDLVEAVGRICQSTDVLCLSSLFMDINIDQSISLILPQWWLEDMFISFVIHQTTLVMENLRIC